MDVMFFIKNNARLFFYTMLTIILFVSFLLSASSTLAANDQSNDTSVLVLYSTGNGEINEYVKMLDLTIGSSTTDIKYINVNQVKKKDFHNITHLIYYGFDRNHITYPSLKLIKSFDGPIFAIGHNTDQLGGHYSFLKIEENFYLSSFLSSENNASTHAPSHGEALRFTVNKTTEVLAEGIEDGSQSIHPVLVKNRSSWYFGVTHYSYAEALVAGPALKSFLGVKQSKTRPAYIRLEDIHPLVDPEKLKATGDILAENKIPYMIAVIPVYTDPDTGEETHFSDSPKLLKVLKEMQENGGSIVLHGYTHQFRQSETGEGFEFWDVDNNRPIYAAADDKDFELKTRPDFPTEQAYKDYLAQLKDFESSYIRERLTRGIQELSNYGLYPLAFEAPHYTMSQNGYHTVAEFFNIYVGQIQLSDQDWETMDSSPYVTKPALLPGLEIMPETLGYLPEDDTDGLELMRQKAALIQLTDDGIASAFYHPYLGAEGIRDVIKIMRDIPNLEWIDLKEEKIQVTADNVTISTVNGQIVTDIQTAGLMMTSFDFPLYHIHEGVKFLSWVIAVSGLGMVTVFILFISMRRHRSHKMEEV